MIWLCRWRATKGRWRVNMPIRLCVYCKHFEIVDGDHGYSALPPVWDVSIGCSLAKWIMDKHNTGGPAKFRRNLLRAVKCDAFRLASDE